MAFDELSLESFIWKNTTRAADAVAPVIIHYHIFQMIFRYEGVRAIRPTNSHRIDGEGADAVLLENARRV